MTFQHFEEMEMIMAKCHDINPPFVDGSGVPAANKKHIAIRAVRSSSPKAGSSYMDNDKIVEVIAMIKSIHH